MGAKYRQVADSLTRVIQAGAFQAGERLPGEVDLARTFDVSRGTIRQALSSLQTAGLIETWSGAGSFVCYNGARLDDRLGWSRALAAHGVEAQARTLRFERVEDVRVAESLGLSTTSFLALDRLRSTLDGERISLERSRLPWRPSFASLLKAGLVEGSLRRTLETLAIQPMGGSEAVGLVQLSAEEAAELRQPEGEPFLETIRVVHDAAGMVIERVRSLLHPAHFTLQLSFGDPRT